MPEKREVFFLVGRGGAVMWSDAGQSPVAIADSRARWKEIWERREDIEEIAHSHPLGPARFSREDETTMQALDSGLGHKLRYSVVSPQGMIARVGHDGEDVRIHDEPWWAGLLRRASGMEQLAPAKTDEACVEALRRTLAKQLRKRVRIRCHQGPDLVVHAANDESRALLVVEVGNLDDERTKVRAHAKAETVDYWIVDPRRRCVEVHRKPVKRRFTDVNTYRAGAILTLVEFDEVSVCVDDIV